MKMSKKHSGFKKFALGAIIGAGIGMLFAPKKGSETRKELKEKLNTLVEKTKDLKNGDIKKTVEKKVVAIQQAIDDLDAETVLNSAKNRTKKLQSMVSELASYIAEKSIPALDKTISVIQEKTDLVVEDALKRLGKK